MTPLKPIETVYKGYRFRSRLESRWAVFMDALGVKYEYEPQEFELGAAGRYLPDFWLPEQQCWVEIKWAPPTNEERSKAAALATAAGVTVFVFDGECRLPTNATFDWMDESATACFPGGGEDYQYWWCECPSCGSVGIRFNGRSDRLPCKSCIGCSYGQHPTGDPDCAGGGCPRSDHGDKGYNASSPRLVKAYEAARQARFEHGQVGAPGQWPSQR